MIQSWVSAIGYLLWRVLAALGAMVWSVLRPGLRVISTVLLLTSVIALTIDATRWQTAPDGRWFLSLADEIRSAAPATLEGLGIWVSRTLHPFVWDPLLTQVLALPAWLVLAVLGIAIGYAARERRQVDIFIN